MFLFDPFGWLKCAVKFYVTLHLAIVKTQDVPRAVGWDTLPATCQFYVKNGVKWQVVIVYFKNAMCDGKSSMLMLLLCSVRRSRNGVIYVIFIDACRIVTDL